MSGVGWRTASERGYETYDGFVHKQYAPWFVMSEKVVDAG